MEILSASGSQLVHTPLHLHYEVDCPMISKFVHQVADTVTKGISSLASRFRHIIVSLDTNKGIIIYK